MPDSGSAGSVGGPPDPSPSPTQGDQATDKDPLPPGRGTEKSLVAEEEAISSKSVGGSSGTLAGESDDREAPISDTALVDAEAVNSVVQQSSNEDTSLDGPAPPVIPFGKSQGVSGSSSAGLDILSSQGEGGDDPEREAAQNSGQGSCNSHPNIQPAQQQLPTGPPTQISLTHQALVMGQQGWEKSPDRPPQKLPIRFKDCVGRHFLFPWKTAKKWKGTRALINSAFLHVDVLGPQVQAGHYDLIAHHIWTGNNSGAVNPELVSFQHMPQAASPTPAAEAESNLTPTPSTAAPAGPSANPSGEDPPAWSTLMSSGAIVLPELWEDIVEPGMMISMHMWPRHPGTGPPHAAPAPPPLPPPPAPLAGRGGFGPVPPQPPGMWNGAPRPREIHVVHVAPLKMKTRKRQDGL